MKITPPTFNRRNFLKASCPLALAAAVSPFAFGQEAVLPEAKAPRKPNILMICIDDLNDWVGYMGGHPDVKTPNMDRLASQGRAFMNAHCVVPVCSASRASIMSGLHATTHGSYELGPNWEGIPQLENVPMMQEFFKNHGYTILSGGKVLHKVNGPPLNKINDVDLGGCGGPSSKTRNWPGGAWNYEMDDYQLAKRTAAALQKEYDKPFFISAGFFRPHVPLCVPKKWFDLYDRDKVALPNVPEDDLDDVPDNFKGRLNIEPLHTEVVKRGAWRGMVHSYLACISFVDMCVGTILDSLEASPYKDNTIIVLWSDHGFHLGEKQKWGKRTLWEESTRTPFIIAGPGISKGESTAEAVSLLDIYPTLVELTGIPQPGQLDGVSLKPQLDDPAARREIPAMTSSMFGNHAIRTRDWRYIRYADGAEELYDHRVDPDEFTNLASHPEHTEVKASLAKFLPVNPAPEVVKRKGGGNTNHE